jgi:hypothetical protein
MVFRLREHDPKAILHGRVDCCARLTAEAVVQLQLRDAERILERAGKGGERAFSHWVYGQADFALAHRGWYRLIWLEPLSGPPPRSLLALFQHAGEVLVRLILDVAPRPISRGHAAKCAEWLHTYLHGALCKAISGRLGAASPVRFRRELVASTRQVLNALLESTT